MSNAVHAPVIALALALGGCGVLDDAAPADVVADIRLGAPRDESYGATVELAGLPAAAIASLRDIEWERGDWSRLLRITVAQAGTDLADTPAVLGDYAVGDDDIVRFTPMFPFDRGRPYTVRFDPAALPGVGDADDPGAAVTATLELPRPDVTATTVVTRVLPTGDRLPANQLKLYIEFSAPMSDVDGLDYIRLLDDAGQNVEAPFLPLGEEFWDYNFQRYTVFFDPGRVKTGILPNEQLGRPLEAGTSYTLEVDAAWPDAEGTPLAASFTKRFSVGPVDDTPIDTAAWRLRVPPAGSTSRLVVSFPEPLDHGLLHRGLAVENSDGERIAGSIEVTSWETRWSFTPEQPWSPGAFSLVALSILEDLAGNRIGVPFEIDRFEQIDDPEEQDAYRVPFEIAP